jgi:hypothetical protein
LEAEVGAGVAADVVGAAVVLEGGLTDVEAGAVVAGAVLVEVVATG